MKISESEVEHVAKLARLNISKDETSQMTRTLNDILIYMEKMGEIDTSNVKPMTHAIPNENIMREDNVKPFSAPEKILEIAPDSKDKFYRVPRVID